MADQISHCAQSLRALEAGASRGADSVAALLEARDEIVDQVGVMEARYRQAGAALEEYAVVLDRAQSESLRAWYAARDAAAVRAMGLIAAAKDADGVADSWWDDWGRTVVKWMTALAEAVGAITGVLALVFGWIPILGQAVSGVFLTISVILGTVAAIGHTALWLAGDEELLTVLVSVALALVGLGALKGAARLGTAMCKGMLKHVEFLARAKGAASSVLGKVGLRALLRPGGVPAILRYRFRNAMVGQLGEESMLVGLWPKVRYRVPGLTATGAPRTGLPDLNISILGRTYMGEVKFLQAFTNKEKLVNQIIGYAHNAGEVTTDGLRAATEINVTCQFGQGVNHYFSGWGG